MKSLGSTVNCTTPSTVLDLPQFLVQQLRLGGGLQLVNTSPHLSSAQMSNEGLFALLAAESGQNYVIDVFDSLLPVVESAVLAALHLEQVLARRVAGDRVRLAMRL